MSIGTKKKAPSQPPQLAVLSIVIHKHSRFSTKQRNGHISMSFLLLQTMFHALSVLFGHNRPVWPVWLVGYTYIYYIYYLLANEMSKRVFIWFHAKYCCPQFCLFDLNIQHIYCKIQRHQLLILLNLFDLRVDIWSNGYEYGLQTQIVCQRQRRKWHRDCRCW